MPNWVYNGLTIEGPTEQVTKLVSQLNQPFDRIHDSWDMEFGQMKKKLTVYSNPVFAFWNIIKPTDIEAYDKQADLSKDIHDRSGDDWYNWNLRNWGVKWDVAVSDDEKHPETYTEGPVQNGENLVIYYNFNTAWGLAEAALTNLSSQYPNLLFTLSYEEETGWGGEIEFVNGKTITHEQYDNKCRECDTADCLEYCEDCENDVCSECNFGAEDICDTHKEKVNA
jgi:hypothetical protein